MGLSYGIQGCYGAAIGLGEVWGVGGYGAELWGWAMRLGYGAEL